MAGKNGLDSLSSSPKIRKSFTYTFFMQRTKLLEDWDNFSHNKWNYVAALYEWLSHCHKYYVLVFFVNEKCIYVLTDFIALRYLESVICIFLGKEIKSNKNVGTAIHTHIEA